MSNTHTHSPPEIAPPQRVPERRFWAGALGFLALIALATAGIVLRGSTVGIGAVATPNPGTTVSGRARIVLTFPTTMHTDSVESRLTVMPETSVSTVSTGGAIRGHWSWEANGVRSERVAQFIPEAPLAPGGTYRVTFAPGATATNGRAVTNAISYSFTVRLASLLFLRADVNGKASTVGAVGAVGKVGEVGALQLWSADADGGNARQITHELESVQEFTPAPDGSRIAYTTQAGPQTTALWAINSDGSGRTRLSPAGDPSSYATPAWSPVGNVIVYVLRGVVPDGRGGVTLGTSKLWAVTPNGKALGRIYGRGDEVGFAPVWSSDGTHLAFREQVDAQNISAIVLSDLSPDPVKVPAGPGNRIAWAPDGVHVAYDESIPAIGNAAATGGNRIVIVAADGSAPRILGAADASAPDWSPDGTQLVFASHTQRADGTPTTDIAVIGVNTHGNDGARRLLGGDGLTSADPVWSPDGQTVIATRFSTQTGNDRGLWQVHSDGTAARLIVSGGEHAVWVP